MYAWVFIVMLAGGILGGLVGHFRLTAKEHRRWSEGKSMLAGIAAALIVPVFLNAISSDLLTKVLASPRMDGPAVAGLFQLLAFCVLAAISANAFIDAMSQKMIQQIAEDAAATAKSAADEAAKAKATAEEAKVLGKDRIEPGDDEPLVISAADLSSAAVEVVEIDSLMDSVRNAPFVRALKGEPPARSRASKRAERSDEDAVLKALSEGEFVMRSVEGVAGSTGLDPKRAVAALASLQEKGIVADGTSLTGAQRWYVRPGRGVKVPGAE